MHPNTIIIWFAHYSYTCTLTIKAVFYKVDMHTQMTIDIYYRSIDTFECVGKVPCFPFY